jgi:hypothetical protein
LQPLRDSIKRWPGIILRAVFCSVIGIALQHFLLAQLNRPITASAASFVVNWILTFLVSILFVTVLTGLKKSERVLWMATGTLVGVIFALQWLSLSYQSEIVKPFLAWYGHLMIMSAVILTKMIYNLCNRMVNWNEGATKKILIGGLGVALLISAILFYQSALAHAQLINTDISSWDQSAFISFAKNAWLSRFTYIGDYNRMPLYPFFQALFYQPGMSDPYFFDQGKQINILLSLGFLIALLLIYLKFLSIYQSFLLTMISAYALFIFKAGYFKVEPMFYFLAFLGFVLMLSMLRRPNAKLAIFTGAVTGIAYLSKASALLGLMVWVGVYGIKLLTDHIWPVGGDLSSKSRLHNSLQKAFYLLIVLGVFFIAVYPYTRTAKQNFGRYFFNINSTFYVWFDDFDSAKAANHTYGLNQKWPDFLPDDQIPGMQNYLREHSIKQIKNRIIYGVNVQRNNLIFQYLPTNFVLVYFAVFIISIIADLKNTVNLSRKHIFLIGFTILYILVYLASFTWYAYISNGRRFTYGIYLPLLFALFVAVKNLAENQSAIQAKQGGNLKLIDFNSVVNILISEILLINIWFAVTWGIYLIEFGA